MILKRFYEEKLAQASFLVGCAATGEAIVIDPNRDVTQYVRAAATDKLRITGVTETHIHADFLSGARELALRTGARLYLSDEGDADWKYGFANEPNVTLVRDGSTIRAGNVRLDVVKTPGHTPEHISFVLTDERATNVPLGVFTGDFIFVGDVGRPDLLERAANLAGTMEKGAHTLFQSLAAFKARMPDHLILWPGHGAGSACGKSLGGVPVSTLAYEKLANWGLRTTEEDRFVAEVLAGQPDPPAYFKEMKRLNQAGPAVRGGIEPPPLLEGGAIVELLDRGEWVVDVRAAAAAAEGFVPGTLLIPMNRAFTSWAGSLLPYDRPLYLLSETGADGEAIHDLAMIGLDDVRGRLRIDALAAWERTHGALDKMPRIGAREAIEREQRGEIAILDVRSPREHEEGHIRGALHIPLGQLAARVNEVPADATIVVHCGSGTRSPIAISLLRKLGRTRLIDMAGGFTEYAETGLPVETGANTSASSTNPRAQATAQTG